MQHYNCDLPILILSWLASILAIVIILWLFIGLWFYPCVIEKLQRAYADRQDRLFQIKRLKAEIAASNNRREIIENMVLILSYQNKQEYVDELMQEFELFPNGITALFDHELDSFIKKLKQL